MSVCWALLGYCRCGEEAGHEGRHVCNGCRTTWDTEHVSEKGDEAFVINGVIFPAKDLRPEEIAMYDEAGFLRPSGTDTAGCFLAHSARPMGHRIRAKAGQMTEEWKSVISYGGRFRDLYLASSLGRICHVRSEKALKPCPAGRKRKYLYVRLWDGRGRTSPVAVTA